jgi:hypothetical protein
MFAVLCAGAVTTPAAAQCNAAKFGAVGVEPMVPSGLGLAVAIDGPYALAGAEADSSVLYLAGAAYAYRFDGSAWSFEAKLQPSDSATHDRFGSAVAISGTRAVIGAWQRNAAYVYEREGDAWIERAKLEPDYEFNGTFGAAGAIDGDVIVVGDELDYEIGENAGAVYVFRFDGTEWTEEAQLRDRAAPDAHFGIAVDVREDVLVVGAAGDDEAGVNAGAAHVYRWSGSEWVHEVKLVPADLASQDLFGTSVSVTTGLIAVGATLDDDANANAGSAYVFRYDEGQWVQEAKLLASDPGVTDRFGAAVAMEGGSIVVGANWHDGPCGIRSGAAYVFAHDGKTWAEVAKLLPPAGAEEEFFGGAVAMSGQTYLAGSWGTHAPGDPPEAPTGAVSFFDGKDCGFAGYCAPASGLLFDAKEAWLDAVGESVFIGFTGFPAGTWITDQYKKLGVIFGGDANIVWPSQSARDGWRMDGNADIDLVFANPQRWIGVDYFGGVRIELFLGGEPVFTTDGIIGAGFPPFAGILLPGTFDRAVLTRPKPGDVVIDNLYFGSPKPGDIDFDGVVNVQDLLAVILDWGLCVGPPPAMCLADHDGSGTVDENDLSIVIANWDNMP